MKKNGETRVTRKTANSRALGVKPFSTATEEAFLENLNHALVSTRLGLVGDGGGEQHHVLLVPLKGMHRAAGHMGKPLPLQGLLDELPLVHERRDDPDALLPVAPGIAQDFLHFPGGCIAQGLPTTCISAHRLGEPGPMFDMVIMDEASQCNTAVSLVPILRGESLMLVGDPQQLNPVILLEEVPNRKLRKKYNVAQEYYHPVS